VSEVPHRGTDGARVALDNNHAEATGVGFDGVREADHAGADNYEVGGTSGCVVGHEADCTVAPACNAPLV